MLPHEIPKAHPFQVIVLNVTADISEIPAPFHHAGVDERVPELADRVAFPGARDPCGDLCADRAEEILDSAPGFALNDEVYVVSDVG